MRKEIILYFDEPKTIDIDFYNYDYDHEYPSQTITVKTDNIKIKYCHEDMEEACYLTNATSIEFIDHADSSTCHAVSLFKENKVKVFNSQLQTVIEIY